MTRRRWNPTFPAPLLAALSVLLLAGGVRAGGAALPAVLPSDLARQLEPWQATFVISDVSRGAVLVAGDRSPDLRSSPCSTFKIFHALAGLETGLLRDLDHLYKWDGVRREREPDNRDATLRSALRDSVVWYFQRLAAELGEARERDLLARAAYGNQDTSAGLTTFWLDSSLQISPAEQVAFLSRISAPSAATSGAAPFSARSIQLIREGLLLREFPRGSLRGKTGSAPGGRLGWFVGWVERGGDRFVFALRLERRGKDGPPANGPGAARPLAEKLLGQLGLL